MKLQRTAEEVGRRRERYTNQTAYGKEWGLAKANRRWERDNYCDDWIQVKGQWQKNYNREGENAKKRETQ